MTFLRTLFIPIPEDFLHFVPAMAQKDSSELKVKS